jgi:Sap-like sulfolipid-1-addressing protein
MLLQAAGLALLASLSPTALLVAAVYLGSARPRLTAAFYLAGAVVMSLVMGVVLLLALRAADLNRPAEHTSRYGLRLGLGILLVAVGIVIARREPRAPDPAKAGGIVSRMVANPSPLSAFLVGLLIFAPGVTFLAAVQVIATARADVKLTVLAVSVVVVINVLLVWLPIVLHFAAPTVTTRYLTAFNGWLRANGRTVLVWVFVVVGAIMVGNGIYGLAAG